MKIARQELFWLAVFVCSEPEKLNNKHRISRKLRKFALGNKRDTMLFDDYKQHADTVIRPSLLWEYDMSRFDWAKMRNEVVQRVLERGRMDDYYAMLNRYGWEGVREALRMIPYMNRKDMNFACFVFDLKKEELRCYTMRPLHPLYGHF